MRRTFQSVLDWSITRSWAEESVGCPRVLVRDSAISLSLSRNGRLRDLRSMLKPGIWGCWISLGRAIVIATLLSQQKQLNRSVRTVFLTSLSSKIYRPYDVIWNYSRSGHAHSAGGNQLIFVRETKIRLPLVNISNRTRTRQATSDCCR